MFTVTCADGRVRHAPFPTQDEALTWAEWGHVCLAKHTIEPGQPVRCRDCGLGAVPGADGRYRGEQDIDPCPAGTDDFHHWIGLAPSACINPTHDHDAIISPGGMDPDTNLCNDCKRPCHYDRSQEDYFHDSPDPAHACFLAGPNADNPCVVAA